MEKSPSEINRKFSPKNCDYVAANLEKACTADVPTIAGFSKKFGTNAAEDWIYAQLLAIYANSGNKEKAVADGMLPFAKSFVPMVGGYKLTELMVFFSRYKAGRYGLSFSSFDPRQIGSAFFNFFVKDIQTERGKYFRKEAQNSYVNNRFTAPEGYSPLELYKTLRRYADEGDGQAKAILCNPNATTEEITDYLKSKKK